MEDFTKPLTEQEIKVKCLKDDKEYEFYKDGEYEALYVPPCILHTHAEFLVWNKYFRGVSYDWKDFFEYFEVLDKDFKGIPYIKIEFQK